MCDTPLESQCHGEQYCRQNHSDSPSQKNLVPLSNFQNRKIFEFPAKTQISNFTTPGALVMKNAANYPSFILRYRTALYDYPSPRNSTGPAHIFGL